MTDIAEFRVADRNGRDACARFRLFGFCFLRHGTLQQRLGELLLSLIDGGQLNVHCPDLGEPVFRVGIILR